MVLVVVVLVAVVSVVAGEVEVAPGVVASVVIPDCEFAPDDAGGPPRSRMAPIATRMVAITTATTTTLITSSNRCSPPASGCSLASYPVIKSCKHTSLRRQCSNSAMAGDRGKHRDSNGGSRVGRRFGTRRGRLADCRGCSGGVAGACRVPLTMVRRSVAPNRSRCRGWFLTRGPQSSNSHDNGPISIGVPCAACTTHPTAWVGEGVNVRPGVQDATDE